MTTRMLMATTASAPHSMTRSQAADNTTLYTQTERSSFIRAESTITLSAEKAEKRRMSQFRSQRMKSHSPLRNPISQSSRTQRITTATTTNMDIDGSATIQCADAKQQIADSPAEIVDIVDSLLFEQHGTIQTAQPANGSVDAQQSLLENQEAIFALDKHLLEQTWYHSNCTAC
eukprot:TRINITY_DN2261_c0_g2_i5.p1 TRINITY_DN2261_c0_g2~~TRINITY_DN2261_c0_g2_i5.p1  ORF type:complete len:174 (+),score=22.08 TRINITY_DN2261_c0_g2_i5:99-620(+)